MIFSANFCLYELFSQSTKLGDPLTQMSLDEMIILLRLEANASLSSISEIVKLHNYSKSSVHYRTLFKLLAQSLTIQAQTKIGYLNPSIQ